MTFNNYETKEPVAPRVITDEEKTMITDDYALGKTVTQIKHERFIPTSLIENSIRHKKITEAFVVKLMNKQVVISPAEYDEEGVLTKNIVYNNKPSTLTALKIAVNNEFPDCTITDYNVDAIVSNGTSAGTWTAFSGCF